MKTPWQTETADRDSVTHIYVKPEPVVEPEPHRPTVRSYEVEDRFTLPVFSSHGMRSFTAPHLVPTTPIAPPTFVPPAGSQVALIRQPAYAPDVEAQTHAVRRQPSNMAGLGYAAICVVLGVVLGGVFAFSGSAPAAVAAPVVTSRPAVAKILPPAPIVTPIVEVAPVAVAPAPVAAPVAIAPVVVPAPVAAPVVVPPPVAAAPVDATRHHHTSAVPAREVAPAVATASGTLQISSKPPCAIAIDGKATGLTSPQRAIALAPGQHVITLSNAAEGIHLTTEVTVTADHATQLIRDFTD